MTKRPATTKRKAGRPRLSGEAMPSTAIRLSPKQKEKLARLGGAAWVRDQIDKAKEPT